MNKDQAPPYHSLLVIDDHNMIVNGIRLLIGDWFSVFYHANDGATGIRLALEHQPQLVIVDQVLPDHSGDAVAREIKYRCPTTRILAYSFNVNATSILKMFEAGVHGYVIKSENDAEFEKAVAAPNPYHSQVDMEALAAAQARLAAIDSGVAQPVIPTVPGNVASHSIPTTAVAIPKVAVTKSSQGRRVALVIGNSAYENVPALPNPQKDAAAMAAVLRNIGFEVVTLATNLTHEKMIASLRDFAHEAEKSDWAMVYYAGHGMEVGGVNYLIPVDARIAVDRDIQFEAVPLSQVLSAANTRKIKLIVLDACRDNPFTPRKSEAPETVAAVPAAGAPIATRSTSGRGLAEVKVQGATLVVYAARDGQVALDGDGGNSPFAVAMVQRVATPGVEINKVFRLVRDDVVEATAGRQEPYTYGSLGSEDFFFVPK